MKQYRLNIDGKEVLGLPGQTILAVARENDITIPTLCYDERTAIYGSCGLCMVEIEGNPKLMKSCATEIAPNMIIKTNTHRVKESRKTNLELLLSNHKGDCVAPCALHCPAGTDCQGYVGLVANGQLDEALKLIKERIPLPGSLGRVCPHPCEDHCRRKLVDEPISIAWIKRFAADFDAESGAPYLPEIAPETGKSVAIIGGGPYGLSAAYFLRQMGHAVTIYDAMPKFGGMLRYGIPEYRLPKAVVDEEVETIAKMGVTLIPNTKVGVDVSFDTIRRSYDAVLIGIGAWVSTGTGCAGEDVEGVIGGIDFLRKVVRNEPIKLGKKVAIVGGGNTAMDACRTAVRLGAEQVYNIYRRTKDEMPADLIEIEEGEEEGVIFKNLTNPIEILPGADGRVSQIHLQVMELGEADASGRRAPVAVEGKTELLDVDTVILAIGQKVNATGLDGLTLTRKGGIVYDKKTFRTALPGVFCGGDCGNDKISIAVESLADARKGSYVVDGWLRGLDVGYEEPYTVKRNDITEKTFEDRERQCRPDMAHMSPEERRDNFAEIVHGFTAQQAMEEAQRCLECGCHDYFECKLVNYANQYDVKPERIAGDINEMDYEDDHPFILRDPNKCVLCGLCVRICDQVMGIGALGLVHRGFDTVVQPALKQPLATTACISCGQCVSVCPTGALGERLSIPKSVPLATRSTPTTCSFCSVGCSMELESGANMLIKATPNKEGAVNKGLLCAKGRFGFDCADLEDCLRTPVIAVGEELEETHYQEATVRCAKGLESIATRYGKDSVAVAIGARLTNEEAFVAQQLAQSMGAKTLSFDNKISGLQPVLGIDRSPNTIDELLSTNVILAVGFTATGSVLRVKLKQAAENGADIVLINPVGMEQSINFLHSAHYVDNNLSFLRQVAKGLLDMGKTASVAGFEDFVADLAEIVPSQEAVAVANLYGSAKKAMILFQQNLLSVEAATLLADIALLSGHIGAPRDGMVQVKAKNNSQGLIDLGITAGAEGMEGIKGLLVFGESPDPTQLADLEFLAVCDTHLTPTAQVADVVFPATGFACAEGTFTNLEGRIQGVHPATPSEVALKNWQVAAAIANVYETLLPYNDEGDIKTAMASMFPAYRDTKLGEVMAGEAMTYAFVPVAKDAPLAQPTPSADHLMSMMDGRMP